MGPAIVSIVVAAIGAILRFATNVHSATWNVRTIGDILMIVGIFGFVVATMAWAYWDGWGFGPGGMARSRRTTIIGGTGDPVYGPHGYARTTYDAGYSAAPVAPVEPAAAAAPVAPAVDPLDPTRPVGTVGTVRPVGTVLPVGTVVEEEERSVF